MSTQSNVRAALAQLIAREVDSKIAVTSAGVTCVGFLGARNADAQADVFGEKGVTTGTIHVSAGLLSAPQRGATITIDGKDVFVLYVSTDAAGAVMRIQYSEQSPR